MSAHISLKVRLGPLVAIEIEGEDCKEIAQALEGWEGLNKHIDNLCSDLAERVYPEGLDTAVQQDCCNGATPGQEQAS